MITYAVHSYLWTSLLCVAIAVLLHALDPSSDFLDVLAVSFCIGLSISSGFSFLQSTFNRFMPPYISPIIITALGLSFGLLLAGTLVVGRPWFFFSENYTTPILGVFFGIVGFLLFGTRARLLEMRARLAEAEAAREAQERETLETQLRLLQAQIEPHFLFNTLSNIAGMIRSDPAGAEHTLVNLTTLLRSSLRRTREAVTTIGEELDIISAYLDIQQIRMKNRLTWTLDVADDLRSEPLAPMLVQPIVENAVRHGIDPLEEGGHVSIAVSRTDTGLTIEVVDDGIGIQENTAGPGTGLRNIRERLLRLYAGGATMTLRERQPRGVRVSLFIPHTETIEPPAAATEATLAPART